MSTIRCWVCGGNLIREYQGGPLVCLQCGREASK